jgi:hypothetical protein
MNAGNTTKELVSDLWEKVNEQIDLLGEIIQRIPPGVTNWKPALPATSFPNARSLGEVTGHLLECLAGFLAVLYAGRPEELAGLIELKQRRVNHACGSDEALQRIEEYRMHMHAGFAALSDADLSKKISTVFVPTGESILTLLLGNFEHCVNHKHELFYYVKLLGIPLTSRDLYRFRGEITAVNLYLHE